MRAKSMEETCKILIQIRNIMDFIDDGYHNKDIANLIKISNELFEQLTPELKKKFRLWVEKRYATE